MAKLSTSQKKQKINRFLGLKKNAPLELLKIVEQIEQNVKLFLENEIENIKTEIKESLTEEAKNLKEASVQGIFDQLAQIKGCDGKEGLVGPQGLTGQVGKVGAKGDKGDTGEIGAKGTRGSKGEQGEKGERGSDAKPPEKGIDYFTKTDIAEIVMKVNKLMDKSFKKIEEKLQELAQEIKLIKLTPTFGRAGRTLHRGGMVMYSGHSIGTGDVAGTTAFTLPRTPYDTNEILMHVGGSADFDWTISGLTITFTTAPDNGATVRATYQAQ